MTTSYRLKRAWIKFRHWEYWPMWVVYLPVSFYYVCLALRARSFFFFSAANPSIETGGMFFESKWDIFRLIPPQYYPATLLVHDQENRGDVFRDIQERKMRFPLIAKPNRGERGWRVEIIKDEEGLRQYLHTYPCDCLLQEYIDWPVEISVFYCRGVHEKKGRITSLTRKEFLNVTGDGVSSLAELVTRHERALLQLDALQKNKEIDLQRVPAENEKVILVPFGNHIRGAMFLDECDEIDERLCQVFDNISNQVHGFYYGRFDIKCESLEALKNGRNFSILELNGAGAEPAHIYQPGFSFFRAQRVLAQHYRSMFDIARANHREGVPYMSFREFREVRAAEKKYKLSVNTAHPSFISYPTTRRATPAW